jgi:hypothetical protein
MLDGRKESCSFLTKLNILPSDSAMEAIKSGSSDVFAGCHRTKQERNNTHVAPLEKALDVKRRFRMDLASGRPLSSLR